NFRQGASTMPPNQVRPSLLELKSVEDQARIATIRRRQQIRSASEWISFGVSNLTGFAALITGATEWLYPPFHPITQFAPWQIAGFGFALLTGPKFLAYLRRWAQISEE